MENGKMGAKVVLHFAAAISLEMVVLYNLTNQLTSFIFLIAMISHPSLIKMSSSYPAPYQPR